MKHTHGWIGIRNESLYVEQYLLDEDRPTIVFLHDSLGCVELWRDFPKKLAEAVQCNAMVYDRLGYGKSAPMITHKRPVNYLELEADVLAELLLVLNIGNAILFGHSDGGSIAILAANKYAGSIKMLICEAAHVFVEDVTLKGIFEARNAYLQTDLPLRLKKYHGDKVDTLFKAWTETWTSPDFRNWNIEDCLPGITCPLLFIQGEADEYATMAQVEKTVKGVGETAKTCIIRNVGHTPHKEVPDVVVSFTANFIGEGISE